MQLGLSRGLRFIGILFALAGGIKLHALWTHASLTTAVDPILEVSNHVVYWIVAPLEIVIGVGLLLRPKSFFLNASLLVLCLNLFLYRVIWLVDGKPGPCSCLGGLLGSSVLLNSVAMWLLTGLVILSGFCSVRMILKLTGTLVAAKA